MSSLQEAATSTMEPDSCRRALIRFIRHERRCWCRVRYWLAQFSTDEPLMRCNAWHRSVAVTSPPRNMAS